MSKDDYHRTWAEDAEERLRKIVAEQRIEITELRRKLRQSQKELRRLRGEGVVAYPGRRRKEEG